MPVSVRRGDGEVGVVEEGHRATSPAPVRSRSSPSQNTFTPSSISVAPGGTARRRTRGAEGLGQLVVGVRGVLVLDLVVPGPEGQRQVGALAGLERLEARDELLPEPGGGPVLHRVARALGDRRILGAVDPQQLVAEVQRGQGAVAALAEVGEAEAERAGRSAGATRSGRRRSGTGRRRPCPRSTPSAGSTPSAAAARSERNTTPSSFRRISLPAR